MIQPLSQCFLHEDKVVDVQRLPWVVKMNIFLQRVAHLVHKFDVRLFAEMAVQVLDRQDIYVQLIKRNSS